MAGLKKKKKEKSGNPNTVLVVFLVLFVLISIGLGVWGYYGYAGQEDLRGKERSANATAKSEKSSAAFHKMLWRDLRQAIGEKLEQDEETELNLDRDVFLTKADAFKDEKTRDAAKKTMDENRKLLGIAEDGKNYKIDYKVLLETANAKVKELDGTLTAEKQKNRRMEELVVSNDKRLAAFITDTTKLIKDGNTAAVAKYVEKTDAFTNLFTQNATLTKETEDKAAKIRDLNTEHDIVVGNLKRQIAKLEDNARKAEGGGGAPLLRSLADVAPLMLDINSSKPLWDYPVGKIIRVEPDQRTVTINVGSSHGAVPELTFNIFGTNSAGRAEKQMKGSIEIIKVVDPSTSIARITSLYDSAGIEIALNDPGRTRVARETETPIKEGDLLFNLFWGSRVAIAGYVSITGDRTENPAEQMRQMEDFMYLLRRNGMTIDAYVDLRDGEIRGAGITGKTRYLIQGSDLAVAPGAKAAPPPAEGDDEKKEPAKDAAANAGRNEAVNKAKLTLRNEAISKGLLLISAENFATVIGYRRARNANDATLSAFTPRLPYAGSGLVGVVDVAPPRRGRRTKRRGWKRKTLRTDG